MYTLGSRCLVPVVPVLVFAYHVYSVHIATQVTIDSACTMDKDAHRSDSAISCVTRILGLENLNDYQHKKMPLSK